MSKKKELLFSVTKDDFEVTWFSGSGAGGQYRNKHQNCCRIKHKETGVIGTGQSQRNREANRKEAFESVVKNPKFNAWLQMKISEALYGAEESIDSIVDREMENIKVEFYHNGGWIDEVELD